MFTFQVYKLADQLKYFDPVFERIMYEADNSGDNDAADHHQSMIMQDQPWLQQLLTTLNGVKVREPNKPKYLLKIQFEIF